MGKPLQTAVASQRMLLSSRLSGPMHRLTTECAAVWPDRDTLEKALEQGLELLPYCKYLFVLDDKARQVTANISHIKGSEYLKSSSHEKPDLFDHLHDQT